MMQITEDTPPDMLAGAMDLTVHLPNGKSVKTSVERRYIFLKFYMVNVFYKRLFKEKFK